MPGSIFGDLVREVMADHNITHEDAARGSGIARSTITRALDGQYTIPPELTRYLWSRTGDDRIVDVSLGDADAIVPVGPDSGGDLMERKQRVSFAVGSYNQLEYATSGQELAQACERIIAAAADLRRLAGRGQLPEGGAVA